MIEIYARKFYRKRNLTFQFQFEKNFENGHFSRSGRFVLYRRTLRYSLEVWTQSYKTDPIL